VPKFVESYSGKVYITTLRRKRSVVTYQSLGSETITAAVYEPSGTGDLVIAEVGATMSLRVSSRLRTMVKSRQDKPLAIHDLVGFMRDEYTDVNYAQALMWRICPANPQAAYQRISTGQAADKRISYRKLGAPKLAP
jgi:hypothetical protein